MVEKVMSISTARSEADVIVAAKKALNGSMGSVRPEPCLALETSGALRRCPKMGETVIGSFCKHEDGIFVNKDGAWCPKLQRLIQIVSEQ